MTEPKLGPLLLSGLMIGPILGSGIILLPPIVFELAGDYAIVAWLVTLAISLPYAYIFGQLSILFPGDSGIAIAIGRAYGARMRQLAANFLIVAVLLGPVVVLMTAGEYISFLIHGSGSYIHLYGFCLMLLCYGLLLFHVATVSRLSLYLSSVAAVLLLSASLAAIPYFRSTSLFTTPFNPRLFGYSTLILFWSIVGWEIIGNYSSDVARPARTIPRAILYSTAVIVVVTLALAAATQWIDPGRVGSGVTGELRIALVLAPLLGQHTLSVITLLTSALCASTFLMVVGAVGRLIADQAERRSLPQLLAARLKNKVPLAALLLMAGVHTLLFALAYLEFVQAEQIVASANTFLLCNAVLGIAAAMRLLPGQLLRIVAGALLIPFLLILSFSPLWLLAGILALTGYQLALQRGRLAPRLSRAAKPRLLRKRK